MADDLKAAVVANIDQLPKDKPIFMLNLVKFNAIAQYNSSKAPAQKISGREAYFTHYIPAFRAVAAQLNQTATPHFVSDAQMNIITGDKEEWDIVALIKYESSAAFRAIAGSKEYEEQAAPHREAAIKEWKLIATTEM